MSRKRARIEVVVDTAEYFGVNTLVVGNGEHIGHSTVDTSTNLGTKQLVKAIAQRNVVALQEGSILYKLIRQYIVVRLPSLLHRHSRHIAQEAQTIEIALIHVA